MITTAWGQLLFRVYLRTRQGTDHRNNDAAGRSLPHTYRLLPVQYSVYPVWSTRDTWHCTEIRRSGWMSWWPRYSFSSCWRQRSSRRFSLRTICKVTFFFLFFFFRHNSTILLLLLLLLFPYSHRSLYIMNVGPVPLLGYYYCYR